MTSGTTSAHRPELLSPAGSRKHMRYAFAYGADAVYAGQPRYSLRVRNNEFNREEHLADAIAEAHRLGKQFYLAVNLAPHNDKLRSFERDMEPVVAMKPDALIMSDPGLIMMVRDRWPELPVHLSVQANAVNWATVKFWHRMGLTRVILSRELGLEEIADIREKVPEMELEVFVHGALCIAYSGRCLLSGYMNHRDSNQGACTNSCRWPYQVHDAVETATGDIVAVRPDVQRAAIAGNGAGLGRWTPKDATPQEANDAVWDEQNLAQRMFLLQQDERPGEYMPAYEDEHGTYIMNSRDLRAVQHVNDLTRMGVHSLKIEGRTKSHYYVARTAQVYRRAIDDAVAGRAFDMNLMEDLEKMASRGFTEGFYRRHLPQDMQHYEGGTSSSGTQQFVGDIVDADTQRGLLTVQVKNKFARGDEIEIMTPQGNHRVRLDALENAKDGSRVDVAPGDGWVVRIPMPDLSADYTMGLVMREVAAKDVPKTGGCS
jgi:putative protease